MGGKGQDTQPVVAPPQQQVDPMMFMGPMMEFMSQQNMATQQMLEQQRQQQTGFQLPDPSSMAVGVDYAAENKALQEKINQQVTDEDMKRRGVLGTILTDIEDTGEPAATKSSLLLGDEDEI